MNSKTKTRPALTEGARPASNGSLAALLARSSRIERDSLTRPAFQERSSLPSLHTIGVDGQDHINISASAQSELGKLLSIRSMIPFTYDAFGHFTSIEGFQFFIRSKTLDDVYRDLSPARARMRAEKEPVQSRVKHQRALVLDAMHQRIVQLDALREAFVREELPFDLYIVNGDGARMRPANTEWLVEGLTKIRRALQRGHTPLYLEYLDGDHTKTTSSMSVKQKLAYQRHLLRQRFLDETSLAKLEEREEREILEAETRERIAREHRAAEKAAAALPEGAEPIEGLHLTTDVAVEVPPNDNRPVVVEQMDPTTLVRTSCVGYDRMGHYADGRTEVLEAWSDHCGWNSLTVNATIAADPIKATTCVGVDKWFELLSGRKILAVHNAEDCGFKTTEAATDLPAAADAAEEAVDVIEDEQGPAPIV